VLKFEIPMAGFLAAARREAAVVGGTLDDGKNL